MLTAQPCTESLFTRRFPPQRVDDFALEGTEGNRDSCESPPKGKCLLLFRLSHRCFFILFPPLLLFSSILYRQKWFSKQFQPWHLLVQCLPPPAIHICSPHNLDPIRQHQTMAYSSTSPAQCQGSWTLGKWLFFFHSWVSHPLKVVVPAIRVSALFSERGLSCGSDGQWG